MPLDDAGDKAIVGAVEVLKDADARIWYSGQILDLVGKEKLLIGFDGNIWPKEEFPYSRVRKVTKQSQGENDKFNPRIGDEVELRVNATEHHPAAWGAAIVKNIKHSFYFVTRVSTSGADGQSEAIVEKAMLRPVAQASSLDFDTGSLMQESFKVNANLRDWVYTDDAMGCFSRIEADAGLLFIKIGRHDLKLVGDEKATQRAKMILDVHQKHQVQIQNFQDVREKRLEALEKRRNRIEGTGYKHSIEIQIDPSFVRRVIGTKGETIRSVMQKYEVNIHIPDADNNDPDAPRTVRIFGNSSESIEKARGEVEFIEEVYPELIEYSMFGWVRGRGGKTINLFKDLTGIVYARLDRDTRQLTVCGTRNAVEEAMAMFETHMMYYPVFSQMDEEMEQLVSQLEEYGDYRARREWGWYRDDDDDGWGNASYGQGKSSGSKGGKAKGGKGKDKSKDKEYGGKDKGDGKGAKGKEKGRSKVWWEEEWQSKGYWEEEEQTVAVWQSAKAASKGKDGGKGRGKSRRREEAWEEEEEDVEEEESEPQPQPKGKGRGAGRQPRGATVRKDGDDPPPPPREPPAPKPAANRRMGKKGIRS